jgi:UDP-4-amino-4,6-dideoxy-N-acetyl-beta-L-altrosamine transaminase
MIPYGRQKISQADIDAVVKVLQSDFLTQGPVVPVFEDALSSNCKVRYATATNSATSALHIACLALGVGPGDRVWTSPISFVASANCARYCGADIDFVDIDSSTFNISVASLSEKLAEAEKSGNLPKVVIPVHMAGQSCDMIEIAALAERYGFKTIEDASHAIGGLYHNEPIGCCRYSDITVFSFHPVKIVTTGEGGAALTNNHELSGRMAMLRSHGITRESAHRRLNSPGPWYYEQQMLGFNYRMTDIQAALGISQLKQLDGFVARRNHLAARYSVALQSLPLHLPSVLPHNQSAFHLYIVRLQTDRARLGQRGLFEGLRKHGIGANVHYMPIHLQPYYRDLGFSSGQFPHAEMHATEVITLPLYPGMTEAEQDHVITVLHELLSNG